jgi:hypothetical protein
MTIPASLLHHAEGHGCFSGCFGAESDAEVCTDARRPPEPVVLVSCRDCLSFKIGALRSLLPAGNAHGYWLANALTQHFRAQRGYTWSVSGYHARGPGFWLSAAYCATAGLFLLDGERSRNLGSDLDLLLLAFQHGLATASDPRMLDPHQYGVRVVYANFAGLAAPINGLPTLLASPHCQAQQKSGFRRVTLAEFLPQSRRSTPAPAATSGAQNVQAAASRGKPAPPRTLKAGDICPVCKAEVRLRPLLHGTYLGCLC